MLDTRKHIVQLVHAMLSPGVLLQKAQVLPLAKSPMVLHFTHQEAGAWRDNPDYQLHKKTN